MPTIQITMLQRLSVPSVECRNVFYIDGPLIGPTEVDATAAAIRTAYNDHLKAALSNKWSLYGYYWRNVTVAQSQGVEVLFTAVVGSNAAGELLPPQVAGLVSFRTGTPPPNQSRKYIAGMCEDHQGGGTIVTGMLTNLQNWGDAIVNIGTLAGDDQRLGAARINPTTGLAEAFNPYSVAQARPILATMRSRRPGVGI
jgi:hypothetical protein